MIHFRDIQAIDLLEEDKVWLVKMANSDYDGRKAIDLISAVIAGRCGLIRIEGDMRGLMLVRKSTDQLGWTLWIEGLVGEGMFDHLAEFEEELIKLAREKDCQSISGIVERLGLAKVYSKMNCPIVARIFRRVLPDAQQAISA